MCEIDRLTTIIEQMTYDWEKVFTGVWRDVIFYLVALENFQIIGEITRNYFLSDSLSTILVGRGMKILHEQKYPRRANGESRIFLRLSPCPLEWCTYSNG